MFKHKRSQAGFGIVEALCFIVMFSMVGLIGWYVINENQNSQETLDNIGGAEVQTSSSKPASAGEKFTFKELGIIISLPAELKGLTYDYDREIEAAYLSTPAFIEANEKCYGEKIDPMDGPSFGAIGRSQGQYKEPSENEGPVDPLIKQFENFYISGSRPNGITTCTAPGVDESLVHNESKRLFDKIVEAVKSADVVD